MVVALRVTDAELNGYGWKEALNALLCKP
jgi:hypothetical protein